MAGPHDSAKSGFVAFVTGAAGTIGSAICEELVGRSYRVVACDRRADGLEQLAARLGPACSTLAFEITDAAACADAIGQVERTLGQLDALVNNAGAWHVEPFLDSTDAHWEEVLAVTLVAPARLSRLAVPLLRHSARPRIVMIGSKNGLRAEPTMASYDASKAALSALTRSLAVELGPLGILVNCVAPGVIDTDSNAAILEEPALAARYRDRIPLKRFGSPQEVARAVAFFCGPDCGFTTGSTLLMDGGQLAGDPA